MKHRTRLLKKSIIERVGVALVLLVVIGSRSETLAQDHLLIELRVAAGTGEEEDQNRLYFAFASSLRRLGSIHLTTTEERPDLVLNVEVVCVDFPVCSSGFEVLIQLNEAIDRAMLEDLAPAEDLGGDRFERLYYYLSRYHGTTIYNAAAILHRDYSNVPNIVADLDTRCLEILRIDRQMRRLMNQGFDRNHQAIVDLMGKRADRIWEQARQGKIWCTT